MDFKKIFPMKYPVIGMLHLAGKNPTKRAVEELEIYGEEGINGVIIENYHGRVEDIMDTLEFLREEDLGEGVVKGVNVLGDPCLGFSIAHMGHCDFVQFDNISPKYLNKNVYLGMREDFSDIAVLGGVRFKYQPETGKTLEQDIEDALPLCEAIVTTGEATGRETPLEKLKAFKDVMGDDYTLIVGAGVNVENVYHQLWHADAAIVGSAFKPYGDTQRKVDGGLVRDLMSVVKRIRESSQ